MITLLNTNRRTPTGAILPQTPEFARWYARVNQGARFRLNPKDVIVMEDDRPYLVLPLAPPDEEGYPLHELTLFLYNANVGAVLCHSDTSLATRYDNLVLSYGDIVDYMQVGELLDRVPCTPPWGYPADAFRVSPGIGRSSELIRPEKLVGSLDEPDFVTLPRGVRMNIAAVLDMHQVKSVGVSLFRAHEGVQYLWIAYQLGGPMPPPPELCQRIASGLFWCLPRYYAALVLPTDRAAGHPLFPERR